MSDTTSHAELMDKTYRFQRRIYDVTRCYYLLGRDQLIADLAPPKGGHVLEIACGTGRNLALMSRRYPDCNFYGLDISRQMLQSAEARLGVGIRLAQADACDFSGKVLFGVDGFDRLVLSYSLSMIPDWHRALRVAAAQLRPGGELHVVDFGSQSGMPRWFRRLLRNWLAKFHVAPRADLRARLQDLAEEQRMTLKFEHRFLDYAQYAVLSLPKDQ